MQRLLLSAGVSALLLVSNVAIATADVDPSAYSNAVMALVSDGVIDGGNNVRLGEFVNRAEALKIILKSQNRFSSPIAKMTTALPPISLFPDVSQTQWYAPYVEVGFTYGLIKGYPDGKFWPGGGVRVSEAAEMLTRSYGEKSTRFATSADLPNIEGQWYTDALSIINSYHAVTAGSDLDPGAFMTRGQLIDMVYRMRVAKSGGQVVAQVTNPQNNAQQLASSQFASKKDFAITIPSIGIVDLTITHPADAFTQKGVLAPLDKGVGHLFSYPGQGSKIMIYGHSSGYPWDTSQFTKIFRTINETNIGDRIYVTYKGALYVYQISAKKTVPAKETAAFEPDENGEELVLYTCWPPDSITNRYLVYATPVEKVALK